MRFLLNAKLLGGLTVSLVGVSTAGAQATLPDGEGKELVLRLCTKCHTAESVTRLHQSKARWSKEVDDMVGRGAEGTDQELDQIVEYLAKNFGAAPKPPSTERVNVNKAEASELVTGLGLTDEAAVAIVQYREKNGNFKQWQDLANVPGVDIKQIGAAKDRLDF